MFRPYIVRKQGIVNLKSGSSFRGRFHRVAGEFIVMREAALLPGRTAKEIQVVDGELVIHMDDVDFIQLVDQLPPLPVESPAFPIQQAGIIDEGS